MKRGLLSAALTSTLLFAYSGPGQTRLQVVAFYPTWCEVPLGMQPFADRAKRYKLARHRLRRPLLGHENVQSTISPYFMLVTDPNDSITAEFNGTANPSCGTVLLETVSEAAPRQHTRSGREIPG